MLYPSRSYGWNASSFQKPLGVDVQFISGGVYRNTRSSDEPDRQFRSYSGQAHGWLQLTYRPSMELRICDRTWNQSDHPADRAYSKWGDRYPSGSYWGMKTHPVSGSDVNMSGNVALTLLIAICVQGIRWSRQSHVDYSVI